MTLCTSLLVFLLLVFPAIPGNAQSAPSDPQGVAVLT